MTQPPDWAINVPSTPDVHGTITQDTGTQNPLTSVCSMLMGGSPFLGSLVNLGTGSGGGIPGSLVGGSQTLADSLCGFATGQPSSGATADSLLSGASDVNDSVSANNFAMGILDMGQTSGSSGNLALDGIGGGLSFLTELFSLLGACSCSSTYDPNTTTPQDVLAGASDVSSAVGGNPMAMGILGMGGDTGNAVLDAFTGGCSFWGQSCGLLTGNTDVSNATPDSVLGTASGYLAMGNDLLGTNATNGADLANFGHGWSSDFMGLLGNPFGLGSGSASMSIPVDNVAGLLGPPSIGGTAQAMVDGVYQGLTNTSDVGVSLASMTNSMSALARDVAYLKGGSVAAGANPPLVTHYGIAGNHTHDIETWADYLDVVVLGGGGGGYGMGLISLWGNGGAGGHWNAVTLQRGVDIPLGTTTLSITVGAGGSGGSNGSGGNGGASTASGTGWAGISGTGGAGATQAMLDSSGKSPGNETFDDVIYYGGLEQSSAFGGGAGNAPGGGGEGGHLTFMAGGAGAPGAVWVLAYETPGS